MKTDAEAKDRSIRVFSGQNQRGYLLLGHSESLISLSTQFKLRHLKRSLKAVILSRVDGEGPPASCAAGAFQQGVLRRLRGSG
jgi:hypothetical protein